MGVWACMVSLRITFILVTLLAVAIPASAQGEPSEEDPYYLRADVGPGEGPRQADARDDCAAKTGPGDANESAHRIIDPVATNPPDPFGFHGVAAWFPKCTSVNTASSQKRCDPTSTGCSEPAPALGLVCKPAGCPPAARGSYNVTSGRVYLEHDLNTTALQVLGATGMRAYLPVPRAMTMSTGIGLRADCEQCPPVP